MSDAPRSVPDPRATPAAWLLVVGLVVAWLAAAVVVEGAARLLDVLLP